MMRSPLQKTESSGANNMLGGSKRTVNIGPLGSYLVTAGQSNTHAILR